LSNYPHVLKRLRIELDEFFDKLGNRRLDMDALSGLVYTEAVIREILRVHTSAPYTARNSTAEDIVGGYKWPKGTQYIINIHGMNHCEKYWDEPRKFNPDRWLNDTKNLKLMPHIEFGGGRRVCPGRKLAYIALKVMIALIFHKLDIELVDKNTPLKTNFVFVRSFSNLNVRIKPRNHKL
jgi:cytochrome P450